MEILEYEARVKKFAFPENKGYINQLQLTEAFKGTGIFAHLDDPESILTKSLLHPLFSNLRIGSTLPL